jgi:gliding motility-associated-like protein
MVRIWGFLINLRTIYFMKLTLRLILLPLVTLFSFFSSFSQDFSNKGTDFWAGYGYHVRYNAGNPQDMVLYFATDVATNVTVSVPGVGYSQTYSIPANTIFTSNPLPKSGSQDCRLTTEGAFNTGVHITSDNPIVAYEHIYSGNVSGATLLFPTVTLGKEYYSINYTQKSNETSCNSFFFVVATDPGSTSVEITPAATTLSGHAAGVPFTVTLNQGQIYNIMGSMDDDTFPYTGVDLTGSKVKSLPAADGSCKKIAVFSGSGKLFINCGSSQASSSDNLIAQCFPKVAWGQKFMTAPTQNMPYNFFRIAVSDPTAVVKVNGVAISGIINGFYYDLPITNQPTMITADKPIMVAQYITTAGSSGTTCGNRDPNGSQYGDPEMIYLSPVEQTIDKVILNSTPNYLIDEHWINVVIPTTGVSSVQLDGASVSSNFIVHPSDNTYSYAQLSVPSGQHTVTATTGFNVIAYGYGQAESYGYNGGTNIKDLTEVVTLNDPSNYTDHHLACSDTSLYFQITLSYQPLSLFWDFQGFQTPNQTQNNPAFDSTYFINGKQVWRFTLPISYNYSIPGTYPVKLFITTPGTSDCGSQIEKDFNVVVNVTPVKVDFNSITSGCAPLTVTFTDNSDFTGVTPVKYYWDFGDATSSTSATPPPHVYPVGTYQVKYSVTTDKGCFKDTTKTIVVYPAPVAKFVAPLRACDHVPATIQSTSFVNNGGVISTWSWDLGDGTTFILNNGNSFTHTYLIPGTYTIKLVVTTNKGCKDSTSASIIIDAKPIAGFIVPGVCLSDAFAQFIDTSRISDGSALTYLWNFGDPSSGVLNTSTLQNPQHKYNAVGVYVVTLTVTSAHCTDTRQELLSVNGVVPKASFLVLNPVVCSNADLQIKNTSFVADFGNITKVEIYWDYLNNPGAFDVDNTPEIPAPNKIYSHLYPNFQTPAFKLYTVRFRAFSGGVCVDETSQIIRVNASPLVKFDPMPDICFSGSPYHITEASEIGVFPTGSGLYSGNGIIDPVNGIFDPSVAGAGTWTITYTFTSVGGCSDSAKQTIKVLNPPKAKFDYLLPGCETKAVTFIDQSTQGAGNITTWTWDFDDGTPIVVRTTGASFTHTFASWRATPYMVKLILTTDQGCFSTVFTKAVMIYPQPVANFSVSQSCLPQASAQFTDLSTIADGTQSQFTYFWNFGDPNSGGANTSILQNPIHVFTALGPYSVRLVVTSVHGCVDDTTIIYNDIHPQPIADFTPDPLEICMGGSMNFIDKSLGVDTTLRSWLWNFADGTSTSSDQNPTHTFINWGYYNVSLIVTNNYGCISNPKIVQVIVDSFPYVDAGPTITLLQGDTHTMTPVVHANNLTFLWTPDLYMNNNTIQNPVITAVDDILYTVAVTTPGGCTSTSQVLVKVLKPPLIPNTFTPNNDGTNDKWDIKYLKDYPNCRVQVFNRYGQLVFESQGYNSSWDGTYKGKSLPWGTYYYIIEMSPWRKPITGYVTIIK